MLEFTAKEYIEPSVEYPSMFEMTYEVKDGPFKGERYTHLGESRVEGHRGLFTRLLTVLVDKYNIPTIYDQLSRDTTTHFGGAGVVPAEDAYPLIFDYWSITYENVKRKPGQPRKPRQSKTPPATQLSKNKAAKRKAVAHEGATNTSPNTEAGTAA